MTKFKEGNNYGKGRKKGSRNKSAIFTEAFDSVFGKEVGSGEGAARFLEEAIEKLHKKMRNDNMSIDQLMNVLKTMAPYYGTKHTSVKSEVKRTDNTISAKMVKELNEAKLKNQKLEAELKKAKRQPLKVVDEA